MTDAIETIKYKGHTIEICQDENPFSPREWDNICEYQIDFIRDQTINMGRNLIFITRQDNRYGIDCDKFLRKLTKAGIEYVSVALEDMKKNPNFPRRNVTELMSKRDSLKY